MNRACVTCKYWPLKGNEEPCNRCGLHEYWEPRVQEPQPEPQADGDPRPPHEECKRMKKVYIAGPYRGDDSWAVELNIRRAEELGMRVAQMGALPVIPHTMYRYWDGTLTDEFWLACGRELLEWCDAVCVVADSDGSQGTQAELEHAWKMMIRVYHSGSKSQMDALRKLVAR